MPDVSSRYRRRRALEDAVIRRLRRIRCDWFGHAWSRWSGWEPDGFVGFIHERACLRCPAVEVQRDGEEGRIHV